VLVIERATGGRLRTHGHPWAATTPLLCHSLIQAGLEVQISNNLERIKNPNNTADGPGETDEGNEGLPYFDAVVFHGKIEQVDHEAVQALVRFVEGGKGLVVLHIASASFAIGPDGRTNVSEDWKNLIGSIWVYGMSEHPEPPRAVTVKIKDAHHPVTAGMPAEFTLAKEELYSFEAMAKADGGPGRVLAEGSTYDSKAGLNKTDPVAFALERGGGRVLNVYLGHFISSYRDWRFQKLLTQGVEWAARR
jgi:type 1 glutamine amidotransferase